MKAWREGLKFFVTSSLQDKMTGWGTELWDRYCQVITALLSKVKPHSERLMHRESQTFLLIMVKFGCQKPLQLNLSSVQIMVSSFAVSPFISSEYAQYILYSSGIMKSYPMCPRGEMNWALSMQDSSKTELRWRGIMPRTSENLSTNIVKKPQRQIRKWKKPHKPRDSGRFY